MKFKIASFFCFFSLHFCPALASNQPTAQDLLLQSDRARGGLQAGVSWTAKLVDQDDGEKNESLYQVKCHGNNSHVETLEPSHKKGEVMIFNDRTLWYYKTGLKKPVSLSARQKLSGQTANGDIANTNYARDYNGKVVGFEKVGNEDAFKLELKAKHKDVTYDRINYWISAKRRLAIKAEFLTLQESLMKTAVFEYANSITVKGRQQAFVSKMVITDAKNKGAFSTLIYASPKQRSIGDAIFNVNNLVR